MSGLKLVLAALLFLPDTASIILNNGGYEDVYIVIQDVIPENLQQKLLERIQEVFTKSSRLLFTATKNQIYFRKIKIVIPKSWTSKDNYKQLPAVSVLKTFITVDNSYYVTAPHVRSRTHTCGAEGWYMFLTPDFLLETGVTDWGKHENVIVHEWGHLRWGLFDEYADRFGRMGKFYIKGGEWASVSCSANIQGTVGWGTTCNTRVGQIFCNTKDLSKTMRNTCNFCPHLQQSVNISLMGFQYIDALTAFCDKNEEPVSEDQRHNDKAPTEQNIYCNSRSAWEVMREHEDFKSNAYTLSSNLNTTPESEFIQETDSYRVFVLDVSGSMSANDKIGTLYQSAKCIIQEVIPFGSWLAIVTFSTSATKLIGLTRVNSQADRDMLKQALPTTTYSSTCIGCGKDEAIQILNEELGSAENGEVILITDGLNNVGNLPSSRVNAVNAKVVIHTVVVSQEAYTVLAAIATETGGKHFTYLETGTLISEKIDSPSSNVLDATFYGEEGVGNNTSITVLTTYSGELHMQLHGPNNYQQNITENGKSVTMKIPDIAQTILSYVYTSYVIVFSRLNSSNVDYSAKVLPVVFVDVSKSYASVLNATVYAVVDTTTPNFTLDLKDNGMDLDRLKNDGTYTGYIWRRCQSSGRMNIKVKVGGNEGETMVQYGVSGSTSPHADGHETEVIDSSFQRVVVTGELYISNYNGDTTDVTAPGRITDVEINNIVVESTDFSETRNFTIIWTATGDDKSNGQALKYEMKISNDSLTLRDNFDRAEFLNMTNGALVPPVAGQLEALKLLLDAEESYTEDMFFALRAIDDSGNIGPVSNIIPIAVARGFRISGEQGYAVFEDETIITDEIASPTTRYEEDNKSTVIVWLSVPVVVVFLLLMIVVLVIYLKPSVSSRTGVADNGTSPTIVSVSRTWDDTLIHLPSTSLATPAFIRKDSKSPTSPKLKEPVIDHTIDGTENNNKETSETGVDTDYMKDSINKYPIASIPERNSPSLSLDAFSFYKTNKVDTIQSTLSYNKLSRMVIQQSSIWIQMK